MLTNDVKKKLKAGKPVVGVWLALGDAIETVGGVVSGVGLFATLTETAVERAEFPAASYAAACN